MDTTLQSRPEDGAHMDHSLNNPINFSIMGEMDDLYYGSNASTSSSFSSAGPMTPLPTTPSSSRRPSTLSTTTWASQYHSESSSVAITELFSMDSPDSDKQLLGTIDSQDVSYFNDHASPYGPEDELLSLTSHGLPTAQGSISLFSTGDDGLGTSSTPFISDPFADPSGACKMFPNNGMDECLARAMFDSPTQTLHPHTVHWPSIMADPSLSTVIPSQTITIPVTPRKQAFSAMTTPIKNEFISLPLHSGDKADSPTSSTATAAWDFPIRTKRTEAAQRQLKSESKRRQRNQRQPKPVTTSRGTYHVSSTIEKTPEDHRCGEWIPDPKDPDGGRHCMNSFKRREHLSRHRLTHLPNPKKYPCGFCGIFLTRRDNLPPHYLTHRPKNVKGRVRGRNQLVASDELADQLGLFPPKPCKQRIRDATPIRKRQPKL